MDLLSIFKVIQVGSSVFDWYKKANSDDKISREEMADAVTQGLSRVNLGKKLEREPQGFKLLPAVPKENVSLRNLMPEMQLALTICELHYSIFQKQCVVTSAHDGSHMKNSLHFKNLAIDLRTRYLPKNYQSLIANRIRATLQQISNNYQIVLEHDHLHIEFDTKSGGGSA